jgi:DNA repair ATPase RecN
LAPALAPQVAQETERRLTDTGKIDREIGEANEALISISRKISQVIQLAEEAGGEVSELAARLKQLKQEQAEHNARLKELRAELAVESPRIPAETLALVFAHWHDRIQAATEQSDVLATKRMLVQIVDRIELGYKAAVIHYRHPLEPIDRREQWPRPRPQECTAEAD